MFASAEAHAFQLDLEHEKLQHEVDDWRQWWRELGEIGQPRFEEMAVRVARYRDLLSRHFEHEEQTGSFFELADVETSMVNDVRTIWDEHAELLAELDRIVLKLSDCGQDNIHWGDAHCVFETFLDQLQAHNEAESEVATRRMTCSLAF